MGFIGNLQKLVSGRKKPVQKKISRTKAVSRAKSKPKREADHVTLTEWKTLMKELQNHPLTQAKVVNQQMMQSVMGILEDINSKIDGVNVRLDRLEDTTSQIKKEQTSQKLEIKHVKQDKLKFEKRVAEPEQDLKLKLSKSEREILDFLKKRKNLQASEIGNKLKISRSNAALKLNKLYSVGLVIKNKDGKDTFYNLK